MNNILKSLVALSVASACHISTVNAATYEVVDKGDVDTLKFTYSHTQNDAGDAAISGSDVYNFPIQFQYLDQDDFDAIERLAERQFESVNELEDLEDKAALEAGNPTANDLSWAIRYLESTGSSSLYQKVGDIVAMVNNGTQTSEFVVYDEPFEGTDSLTRSTLDYISGITNDGWVYGTGSAPYLPVPFTESDGDEVTHWVRAFQERGYVSTNMGQTISPLTPPEASFYGGRSAFLDANDRVAVGYVSNKLNQDVVDVIEDVDGGCSDPDNLDDLPLEVCIQNLASNLYHLMAYQWTFDEAGQIAAEKELGLLVTPNEDDDRVFQSYAQAVNSHGVAVGFSHGWVDEIETSPSSNERRSLYAVVYKDGEVISFTPDHGKHFDSRAYDINDSGIAVGHVNVFINGNQRTKFYHVDTNAPAEEMEFVLPDDFFNGSSSTARGINENGLVVGEGEVETQNDSSANPRRTHGFLYNIAEDTFTDLNDFLTCNSEYTIIEARDINENNEISATAIVKVPRRNAKGELMLGEDGQQLVEDVVRAVTLTPIPGEIEDCSEVIDKVERKGASIGWALFALLASFGFRRKA